MELNEFIKKTLLEIADAVQSAQNELGKDIINPSDYSAGFESIKSHNISFDVAVTTEDKSSLEGGAKISVMGSSFGGGVDNEALSKIATRIRFEIPMKYTKQEKTK